MKWTNYCKKFGTITMVIHRITIKIIVREKTEKQLKEKNDKLVFFFQNWGVSKKQIIIQ